MVYVFSRIITKLLCMKILALSLSNGCQLATSGDGCEPGWYTLEHNCILMSNVSAVRHLAASDGCKLLGGRLLSDHTADRHKDCLLTLRKDQKSKEIWIDIVKKKSQHCGTIDLTSLERRTVTCNQTVTSPRSYFCEKNSSVPMTTIISTTEIVHTQKSKRAISLQTETTTETTTMIEELCPPGFKKISQGCYMSVGEHKVWEQAQMTCKEYRADLVVISSSGEMDDLLQYMKTSHNAYVKSWWMGFRRDVSADWAWVNGMPMDSNVPWIIPELRTMKMRLCGTLTAESQQFRLSATPCDESRMFFCEYHGITPTETTIQHDLGKISTSLTHQAGKEPITSYGHEDFTTKKTGVEKAVCFWQDAVLSNGNCFEYVRETKTWRQAQAYCESLPGGGTLAHISSDFDILMLTRSNYGFTTGSWIGAKKVRTDGVWRWPDSTQVNLTGLWDDGEPNNNNTEDCVELYPTGRLNDDNCDTQRAFICMEKPSSGDGEFVTEEEQLTTTQLLPTMQALTPRPNYCPQDVKVSSMGQDYVTFMFRHQNQYGDTQFVIAVFDDLLNRTNTPHSPQVSDGIHTYIDVTSLNHHTNYTFRIGSSLFNTTENICDDPLPKIFYCPEEKREDVTFVYTRGGVTVQVPCPALYEGNITRTCDFTTRSWTPLYLYNCTRKSLKIASHLAKDLRDESNETLGETVRNISSELTTALESNTTIVSGEIKQIVNILEQIGEASDKLVVTNDTLRSLASITDKLIEADTSTWQELSSANKTENAGSTLMKAMEDITQSFLKSQNITETLIEEKNIVIAVASTGPTKDNITFPKPDHATYSTNKTSNKVFLSGDALNGSVAYSVIVYTNVSGKFNVYSSSEEESKQQRIGSDVISFSLSTDPSTLSSPLILTFRKEEQRPDAVCSFLDTEQNISGIWSSQGCKTILRETTVDCHCSHLTNFAVLMSMTAPSSLHQAILGYISVIGISISLFCLCLTVTVYSVMWRYVKSDRSVLHVNLCVCLMLGYIVFLGGITKTKQKIACAVTAALLHYLFLAVFCVMLSQGLLILKSVTSVSSTSILRYLFVIMYGTPLVIVAISLGITRGEGFGTDHSCWLSPHNGVLWAFVGPALTVVVMNFFILFAVIRIMQKSKSMVDKNVKRKTKSVVRSIFVLAPILGVTWVLGVLSVTIHLEIFQYLFAICNSLQGLLIFIFQCALQYQVKDGFRALLRRYRATSFDSSQKITSTAQSQEKGYSESGQKTTSFTNTSGSKSQE